MRNAFWANSFHFTTRLAKRREILIFPRTAGNTGNSRELLVIPGNYWEISYSLIKNLLIFRDFPRAILGPVIGPYFFPNRARNSQI